MLSQYDNRPYFYFPLFMELLKLPEIMNLTRRNEDRIILCFFKQMLLAGNNGGLLIFRDDIYKSIDAQLAEEIPEYKDVTHEATLKYFIKYNFITCKGNKFFYELAPALTIKTTYGAEKKKNQRNACGLFALQKRIIELQKGIFFIDKLLDNREEILSGKEIPLLEYTVDRMAPHFDGERTIVQENKNKINSNSKNNINNVEKNNFSNEKGYVDAVKILKNEKISDAEEILAKYSPKIIIGHYEQLLIDEKIPGKIKSHTGYFHESLIRNWYISNEAKLKVKKRFCTRCNGTGIIKETFPDGNGGTYSIRCPECSK